MKVANLEKNPICRFILRIHRVLLMIMNLSLAMVVAITALSRVIFHYSFYGYEEILTLAAFWLYFLGAAYGSYEDSHIKADIVSVLLKNQKVKTGCNLIALLVTCFVNIIFTLWAFKFFSWSFAQNALSIALKIPIWTSQLAILVGLFLMCIFHLLHLAEKVQIFFQEDILPPNQQEENRNSHVDSENEDNSNESGSAVMKGVIE